MSNPFEDLEYLADYLPEEGESVIVSRRSGQLVCEPFHDTSSSQESSTGVINRILYGRLVTIDAKLRQFWYRPLLLAGVISYLCSMLIEGIWALGWTNWTLFCGVWAAMFIAASILSRFRQRAYFRGQACPQLQKQMEEHQIDKYSLIAYLSTQRQLSALYQAVVRWT